MTTYIITTNGDPVVRKALLTMCSKVGTPGALGDILIVESTASIGKLKAVKGVVDVELDSDIEADDVSIQQSPSNWFLPALSGTTGQYQYQRTGKGVDLYVIDSGVNYTHPEFEDRVNNLWSFDDLQVGGDVNAPHHGTMCAGCAGGKVYGVAKEVTIVNVRFDYKYSTSIKAFDIILRHHIDKPANRPSVLSMSFSSTAQTAYKRAIASLIDGGIVCLGSTGNSSESSARFPAGNDIVIGVSALDRINGNPLSLKPAYYSNYGIGTDVWAPGHNGKVASHNSNGTQTANGTSAACPVTAGVMAMHLEGTTKIVDRAGVADAIESFLAECTRDTVMTGKYASSTSKTAASIVQITAAIPLPILQISVD